MRLTSTPGSYGYGYFRKIVDGGQNVLVFLDGQEQKLVVEADEEDRYIIRCVPHDDGGVQIDPDNPEEVLKETVHGDVRIEIKRLRLKPNVP